MLKNNILYKVLLLLGLALIITVFLLSWFKRPSDIEEQSTTPDHEFPPSITVTSTSIPDFNGIKDDSSRKKAFFDYLSPMVKRQNEMILQERKFLLGLKASYQNNKPLSTADSQRLSEIGLKYRYRPRHYNGDNIGQLLVRVDSFPVPMVLVQSAVESGWGSSRFAREGHSFFGQWCFSPKCGLAPITNNTGMKYQIQSFKSTDDSVASYMLNLNANPAYRTLRAIRSNRREKNITPTSGELIQGLTYYSERHGAYINQLHEMLQRNKAYLAKYQEQANM